MKGVISVYTNYDAITDRMKGAKFEEMCKRYLESRMRGDIYVDITPSCGDYGADLIFTTSKCNTVVVQCKHSVNSKYRYVNPRAIQEVVAAKAIYGAQYAMVMSNMRFSENAKILAYCNGVYIAENIVVESDGTLSNVNITKCKDIVFTPNKITLDVARLNEFHRDLREGLAQAYVNESVS